MDNVSTTRPVQHIPNHKASGFDGISFLVGVLVALAMVILPYGCYREYKRRRDRLKQEILTDTVEQKISRNIKE